MKNTDLLEAFGSVNEKYLNEAEERADNIVKNSIGQNGDYKSEKVGIMDEKKYFKKKLEPFIAVAAAFVLVVGSVFFLETRNGGNSVEESDAQSTTEKYENTGIKFIGDYSYYNNGVAYTIGDSQNPTKTFLDFNSMERAPLCAVPNCTHNNSKCISKNIGEFYMPIFYNGYVYYFSSNGGAVKETSDGAEFYMVSKLMKASLNSSEVETVCEFSDCVPKETGKYVLYNNELFFVADDRGATRNDFGDYDWGSSGGNFFLCSINLDTKEYTNYGSIYEDDKEYESAKYSRSSNIYGIYNGKMYISHAFVKDQSIDPTSDEYWTYVNFEFDFETRTWKESDLPSSPYMNSDFYSYYDAETDNVKVLYQEKEYEFELGMDMQGFRTSGCNELNGKVFFPSTGKWYDLTDMSEHSMGEYEGYDAVAYYNESYILVDGAKTVKLSEEELLGL